MPSRLAMKIDSIRSGRRLLIALQRPSADVEAVFLGVSLAIVPCYLIIDHPVDYWNLRTALALVIYLGYVCWNCYLADAVAESEGQASEQVKQVEEGCRAVLVAMSIFFGLVQVYSASTLVLPPHGFDLIVVSSFYAVAGFVPYPPPLARESVARLATLARRRTAKGLWLGASLLVLIVLIINVRRLAAGM